MTGGRARRWSALVLVAAALAGAAAAYAAVVTAGDSPPTCGRNGAHPDAHCTPGSRSSLSRAAVCATRPRARRFPSGVVRSVYVSYGISRKARSSYRLDRLIPVGLGGETNDRNVWPLPLHVAPGAAGKAAVDRRLRALVCSQRLTLAAAQNALAGDWVAAYRRYVRPGGG